MINHQLAEHRQSLRGRTFLLIERNLEQNQVRHKLRVRMYLSLSVTSTDLWISVVHTLTFVLWSPHFPPLLLLLLAEAKWIVGYFAVCTSHDWCIVDKTSRASPLPENLGYSLQAAKLGLDLPWLMIHDDSQQKVSFYVRKQVSERFTLKMKSEGFQPTTISRHTAELLTVLKCFSPHFPWKHSCRHFQLVHSSNWADGDLTVSCWCWPLHRVSLPKVEQSKPGHFWAAMEQEPAMLRTVKSEGWLEWAFVWAASSCLPRPTVAKDVDNYSCHRKSQSHQQKY